MNQLKFNPILSLEDMEGQRMGKVTDDIRQEQNYIPWNIHLSNLVDRNTRYYERIYRYDQGVQKGLFIGKQTTIINTQGKSQAKYESIGMDKALSLTSDKGIFTYCGFEINQHFFFDKADEANSEIIEDWKQQIIEIFKSNSTIVKN